MRGSRVKQIRKAFAAANGGRPPAKAVWSAPSETVHHVRAQVWHRRLGRWLYGKMRSFVSHTVTLSSQSEWRRLKKQPKRAA